MICSLLMCSVGLPKRHCVVPRLGVGQNQVRACMTHVSACMHACMARLEQATRIAANELVIAESHR